MKMRVNEKSNECLSRSKRGQASTQYNNEGKHLERIKLRTTSSEACLPILLKIELNEVKNRTLRVVNRASELSATYKKDT